MSRLPDADDRARALDTTRSFHVEAPAGSGKTSLLAARFLKLLSQVDHPAKILALTFTNKAAGEMSQRCFDLLRRSRPGEAATDDWDATLLDLGRAVWERHGDKEAELGSADGLRITTFHGFCHLLVRAAPLESGVGLGHAVLDEADQPLISRRVADHFCRETLGLAPDDRRRPALEHWLLRLDNRLPGLVDQLDEMIKHRDLTADLFFEADQPDDLEATLIERLETLVVGRLSRLREEFARSDLGQRWAGLTAHLRDIAAPAADELPAGLPGTAWSDLPAWLDMAGILLTKQGDPRKQFGPKSPWSAGFDRPTWEGLIRNLDPGAAGSLHRVRALPDRSEAETLTADVVSRLGDVLMLSRSAIDFFQDDLRSRNSLDYVALEEAALRLFDEDRPTDLQLFLDHRVQHLLVDEFQDTSRRQWDLIRRMCLGWEPGDGRTVFVVGDPKQSIYAFRKAEVGLFVQAGREGIPLPHHGRLELKSLRLSTNFRSEPGLIGWVNELFGQTVMAAPQIEADEVEFQPGEAPPGRTGPAGQVTLSLFHAGDRTENPRQAEAVWLAGTVAGLVDQSDPPDSIGILLQARTHLPIYLTALRRAGVKVRLKEGLKLTDTVEGRHLINLARALVRPHDDLAWAGLLRAPWSWFEISDLVRVRDTGGGDEQPAPWSRRIEAAAPGNDRLARVQEVINVARSRLGRWPLAEVVEAAWLDLDGPRLAARLSGPAGVENCLAVIDLLASVQGAGPHQTLAALEARLDTAWQPEDPATADSPVQMMTIHAAKGLEFDAVFLPDLDRDILGRAQNTGPPYLAVRLPGSGEHLLAVTPDRRVKEGDQLYHLLRDIEKARQQGESKRLFYVAATRARRELHLSGSVKSDRNDQMVARNPRSWLTWLMEHEGLTGTEIGGAPHQKLPTRSGMEAILNPARPVLHLPVDQTVTETSEPLVVHPQAPPWALVSPSGLAGQEDRRPSGGQDQEIRQIKEGPATWRGTVIHRLLETAAQGRPLPGPTAVAQALIQEGFDRSEARAEADDILGEVAACLADDFLGDLLCNDRWTRWTEWPLEAAVEGEKGPVAVLSGELDLAVHDGTRWIIVDYKTGRPGADETDEAFVRHMTDHYRPQLTAYRTMLSRRAGVPESDVQAGLYLTALQRWAPI
jgi:ATP-dependent exoDNAse (exonuclease V) beta subunit